MKIWRAIPLGFLMACGSPSGPADSPAFEIREGDGWVQELRIATIEHYGDPVRIILPTSVARGEELTVLVRTYGGGCISKGDAEVVVSGRSALIVPRDWEVVRLPPDGACTLELRMHEHSVVLRFEEAGMAVVRVRGRTKPSGEVLTVERYVEVR